MKKVDYAGIVHRCFRCGYCKFPSDYPELNYPSYVRIDSRRTSPAAGCG